jgi:hypothetical protein
MRRPALTTSFLVGWLPTAALSDTPAFNTTSTDDPSILNFRLTAPANTDIRTVPVILGTFTLFSPGTGPAMPFTVRRNVSDDGQAFQISLGSEHSAGSGSRPHRGRRTAGADLGERWSSRLVATSSENRLNILRTTSFAAASDCRAIAIYP